MHTRKANIITIYNAFEDLQAQIKSVKKTTHTYTTVWLIKNAEKKSITKRLLWVYV